MTKWFKEFWRRVKYLKISDYGVVHVDPRWYLESEEGQKQINATKHLGETL